jgi:Flp pilus assembly protein TadB
LTPRQKLIVVLPVIAGLVIVLIYFGLFANPVVILLIFVLYVAVSLRNRRKFRSQARATG